MCTKEPLTFGDVRAYCSRIDKVSICMLETLNYQNYLFIEDVPHDYDRYYLYGFGMIESEFKDEGKILLKRCLEFMLSEEPKKDFPLAEEAI